MSKGSKQIFLNYKEGESIMNRKRYHIVRHHIEESIRGLLDRKIQEIKRFGKIDRNRVDRIEVTINALLHSVQDFHSMFRNFGIDNWNIKNLMNEDGTIRKPKVDLHLYITQKGNLVLEWKPTGYMRCGSNGD